MKRNSQSIKRKTRLLNPDLGVDGDDLRSATTSYLNVWPGRYWSQEERDRYLLSMYRSYRSSRNQSTGFSKWPMGSEAISHTCRKKPHMNNCVHIRQSSRQHPVGIIFTGTSGDYRYMYYRFTTSEGYWRDAASVALTGAMQTINDPGFSARAYWSMLPRFQSEVSLINSIFELKDFKDVFPNLWAGFSFIANMYGVGYHRQPWHRILDRVLPPSVTAGLTGVAAAAVLTMNLAIKPTIADVIAIHAATKRSVYDHARQFKLLGEQGARSHFSEERVLRSELTPGTGNNAVFLSGRYVSSKKTATMVSYYDLLWDKLENAYPHWWGLTAGAAEVWNTLPLGFVLDYILTVGKSLEYMQKDSNVLMHKTEYCESIKCLSNNGLAIAPSPKVLSLIVDGQIRQRPTQPLFVTGTQGSYYRRAVMEPYKGPALPQLRLPSTSQAVNMLALARCLLF